jgi:shikimate dehydrogenase
MGWPVAHSRSPRLHGHWLRRYGIDGAYVPLAVHPDAIATALRALPVLGFAGCNLTLPHKELAFPLVDRTDAAARRIGAVNTVVVEEDGTLSGFNTDAIGFLAALDEGAPGWRQGAGPVTVVGAGGAARAVVAGLLEVGIAPVRIVNRTDARAAALAASFGEGAQAWAWGQRAAALDGAHLLVNAATAGMEGAGRLDLDLAALPQRAVVTDVVYVPLETPLLAAARVRGCRTVDGLGMLLHQARPGFRAWFGIEPVVDEALRAAVLAPG